jgi:uncharacterized protein
MSLTMHTLAMGSFIPMLQSLSHVLDKGAEFATAKSLAAKALADARLAPDMYTLRQQVQLSCHHAKDAVGRLTGAEGTQRVDVDEAFPELKARVRATLEVLEAAPASAFEGAEARTIVIPMPGGEMVFEMTGYQFLRDWSLPHFYFHVVTAYDILRHLGVPIGKPDYARGVGAYIRKPTK